jgi:serine/threonine protein kinase/lipoprotein NlpI
MPTTSSGGTPGSRLGDFELLRELGRGGMGVVYQARQVSLNRMVALKVLGGGLALSHKAVLRFQREAEAAAKLHHTNIVPVYSIGEEGDRHYYAMELVEGPSPDRVLEQWRHQRDAQKAPAPAQADGQPGDGQPADTRLGVTIAYERGATDPLPSASPGPPSSSLGSSGGSDTFDRVARMVAEVADALDYAHRNGVVHRDIKPSNLLIAPDGRLSLNDFGLARVLEEPGLTMTGEFVGTPAYMSPEQVVAGRAPFDHRTDIYSLGATLYELLTLQPPFSAARRDQVIGQIISKDPTPPRRLNKRIPFDLETICQKAMEKDPDRRYPTAGALADDLRRFVARHAISARRVGPIGRLVKWARRRPGMAAALGCALVAIGLAGVFAYQAHVAESRRRTDRQQQVLEQALVAAMSGRFDEAMSAIDEAELLGVSTGQVRFRRGQVAYYRGDIKAALADLEQAARLMPDSLAARAMLVRTYMAAGQFSPSFGELETIDRLTPVRAEHLLNKGMATGIIDPREGIALLNEAIRRRDSPIARLARAEVRTELAFSTADAADAEAALKDVGTAADWLPANNPVVLESSLKAHVAALVAYDLQKDPDRFRAARAQADRDATALRAFPTLPWAQYVRWRYLSMIDDDETVLAEWDRLGRHTDLGMAALGTEAAWIRYGRGQLQAALDVLGHLDSSGVEVLCDFIRTLVLAEQKGKERARSEHHRVRTTIADNMTSYFYHDTLLLLLGDAPGARQAYAQTRQRGAFYKIDKSGWYDRLLDYYCGRIDERQLREAAAADRRKLCEAHYAMALTSLARGDRPGARAHFARSVATQVFHYGEYRASRSFLARMNADPAWPPWLPPTP